eukprot:GHVO01042516.1.p1 GENE.GHVO01042516.1~~GHVO01042516.1.p1  ORF type:complete len:1077 (+),score=123.27 GHVO01042516.1:40-3270(+)
MRNHTFGILGCLLLHLFSLVGAFDLTLKDLHLSHGILTPAFSPTNYDYTVTLQHAHDEIAVTPEIDQSQFDLESGVKDLPVITILWPGHTDEQPESASVAIRKQIDIPDDKSPMTVSITVSNPKKSNDYNTYSIHVVQTGEEPLTVLKGLEGSDEWGNTILIEPTTTQDDTTYTGYVHPDAASVMLAVHCASPNWVTVDGRTVPNGVAFPVPRLSNHHRQSLEIACGDGHAFGKMTVRRYVLSLISDIPAADIEPPRVIVDDVGQDCKYDEKHVAYYCPDPKSHDGRVRVLGLVNPSIRYTIESPDKEVEVRMLDQVPTIPFTYRSDLVLVATAGRDVVTWPLHFNAPIASGTMRVVGWILSVLLMLLLTALGVILTFSNMFGLGSPWGATEIANTLTFLSQYLCFANSIRASNLLGEMTASLKWTTLFIPLPWEGGWSSASTSALSLYSSYGGETTHYAGDVTDVHNAYGCLFWCAAIFAGTLLVHAVVMFKFLVVEPGSTFPHRLLLGHWEARVIHLLAFPAVTASAMIIASRDATILWKVIAGSVISGLFSWLSGSYFLVRSAVVNKKVTWVWNASVREDGELEDESGYWSDVYCDQLNTQPVNRSLFKQLFPWQWVSTVADIERVNISPNSLARNSDDIESMRSAHTLYPAKAFRDGTDYPMGKNPKTVEAYRTRPPGVFCPGQRLVAGLLRTQWLDLLFTFEGLSRFHTEVSKSGEFFVVPLTVKTCQLQGPITTGRYCFFFDGARVPFIRILDSLFKILIACFLGIALATKSNLLDAICHGAGGAVAFACLFYAATTSPYSRKIENILLALVLAAVGFSGTAFGITSILGERLNVLSDIFLWFTAIVCIVLATYSSIVTFSVFSAISCAPLEETRFLEKLANCSVTISDHADGWAVDVPAFNKYGARDVKAQCNIIGNGRVHVVMYPSGEEPSLEFDVDEVKQSCRTGALQHPAVVLYSPGTNTLLNYRHTNIVNRATVSQRVSSFLASDLITRSCADVVGRQVAAQMEVRGRDKSVMVVTVVPPKGEEPVKNSGSTARGTEKSRSRRRTDEDAPPSSYYYDSVEMSRPR